MLEFALDHTQIDTQRNDNPWLCRAALSLAETIRLAASKALDIEFTELVTGYRLRENIKGFFVDIYLYDSLSSGAGYAASVADEIEWLLDETESILKSCNCGSSCHKCLKHYRNQHVHGLLDRFAALELLNWGKYGVVASSVSKTEQEKYVASLEHILGMSGYSLNISSNSIMTKKRGIQKKIVVYPAMWAEPFDKDVIYVSDFCIKYARPYAVQKILENC